MVTPVIDDAFTDAFGRQITLNINNAADLASHYPYSSERYRIFVDGARQFIEYDGEPTQYEDTVDSHKLKPQADGEVVTMETNEIYRYVVQYIIEWSIAMQTNQALQSGDVVTAGYGDADLENSTDDSPGPSADGWFFVWDSNLGANEVRLAQYRNGTAQESTVHTVENAITDWTRRAGESAWYSVLQTVFGETYTLDGEGINNRIGTTSIDKEKGPEVGNHPVQISVKTGASGAASLEVEVGSIGVRYLGDIEPILRRKTYQFTASIDATDEWVALDAVRVDPNRRLINVQLTDVTVMEYSASDDVRILAQSFSPDKLRDSGGNAIVDGDFGVPVEHSAKGSVIQTTSAVDQFPNSSGTIQTDGQAADPGGYQEGYGSLYTSGQGAGSLRTQGGQQAKRPVGERDIVVFLGLSGTTGTVTVEVTTEQQW